MLTSRLAGCTDCHNIDSLLEKIDIFLAKYSHDATNNTRFELDKCIPTERIEKIIRYKSILLRRRFNSEYLWKIPNSDIISRVTTLLNY